MAAPARAQTTLRATAIAQALKARPLVEGLQKLSFEIAGESPAEFAAIVKSELERWGPIVKASGFSLDERTTPPRPSADLPPPSPTMSRP